MKELEMADISLVTIKGGYPYCIKHGAMNSVARYNDGYLVYRCITTYTKNDKNPCRAGCLYKKENSNLSLPVVPSPLA